MKDKSLSHALFVIVIIASVLLWVLTSLLLTFSISDNLRHQGRAAITHDLNRAIEIMKELPIDRNPVDAESLWN